MAQQLKPYLDASGRLAIWPAKHSRRLLALGHLASQLDRGRIYTESDLGYELLLLQTCRDAATIRRELFDAGLIDRCPDGSRYWVVDPGR